MINWQLSKQGIRWPVSPDCIAGSDVDPSRLSPFLKFSADTLLVVKWSQAQVCFFLKIHTKYVVSMSLWPCTIKILISNWTQSRKFSKLVKNTGGEDLFLPWSRSPSNFYALIDQNLAAEFLRKTYAASWNLFALTAEADRVLCQLVTFLTVFFHWMYKMKYSCYQESRGFAYWFFGWEISRLSKSEIRFRMASFSLFTLLDA